MKKLSALLTLSLLTAALPLRADVPEDAAETSPLTVGDTVPEGRLTSVDGKKVSLESILNQGPTLLVFYRGGWCPFCTKHLSAVGGILDEIKHAGVQVIAVSPDRPEELQKTHRQLNLSYPLYSDSSMALSRAFGLAFRLDDATLEKYDGYGIDLQAASGEDHYQLPVPAVYLIDKTGTIRYEYANPDYKVRADPQTILQAVSEIP